MRCTRGTSGLCGNLLPRYTVFTIMKVTIATPLYPPEIGGPATYAKTLETELPKLGVEVHVVAFSRAKYFPKYFRHIVYAVHLFRATQGADIVLALDPVSVGLPAALVSLIRGKKMILKVVGDYAWEQGQQRFGVKVNLDEFVKMPLTKFLAQVGFLRMIQKFVANRASRIIVPSKYLKSVVVAWGIPEEKITIVYNAFAGIDTMPVRREVRATLGISGRILISAGRLVPWKGFLALINVVIKLRTKYPDLKLFIAGGGPDEVMLKQCIEANNLVNVVVMLGSIERSLLMQYIRAADCFVLNTGYEGLSHQLLEVLAVGTPIVTTAVGGNVELVHHDVTGLLVSYNDEVALQSAISKILDDENRADILASQGKAFVSEFTVERMVRETVKLLQNP